MSPLTVAITIGRPAPPVARSPRAAIAAFPGCADDTEPSAKTVAFLIDKVKNEGIPAVLYIEFSNEKMADVICEDTGCEKLLFHSCHNVSGAQLEAGISYLELMWGNVKSLKEALG